MSEAANTVAPTNRVLVTLDASARGRAALEVALRLASSMQAELQGMFVEDEDLVRLASLPFSSEIELYSAATRQLQTTSMEESLRLAAEAAQEAFTRALQPANLQWTFRVVRGTLTQASLAAAGNVDLLVIGQQGRSPRLATKGYLQKSFSTNAPVVAIFDGSPSAFRTLEIAGRLAASGQRQLTALVLGNNGDDKVAACVAWLNKHRIRANVNQNAHPSHNAIADFISQWPPSILLVNRDSRYVGREQIRRLVDESDCALVLC